MIDIYPFFFTNNGSIYKTTFESQILESTRKLAVYLPPSYNENPFKRYPVILFQGSLPLSPSSHFFLHYSFLYFILLFFSFIILFFKMAIICLMLQTPFVVIHGKSERQWMTCAAMALLKNALSLECIFVYNFISLLLLLIYYIDDIKLNISFDVLLYIHCNASTSIYQPGAKDVCTLFLIIFIIYLFIYLLLYFNIT